MDEIQKARKSLHQIIEYMAEREQNSDLKNFLKRETVIPTNSPGRSVELSKSDDLEFQGQQIIDDFSEFDQNTSRATNRENYVSFQHLNQQLEASNNKIALKKENDLKTVQETSNSNRKPKNDENLSFDDEDKDEEGDLMDSDIEDMFMDALEEIQDASVKLNQTLGSARGSQQINS